MTSRPCSAAHDRLAEDTSELRAGHLGNGLALSFGIGLVVRTCGHIGKPARRGKEAVCGGEETGHGRDENTQAGLEAEALPGEEQAGRQALEAELPEPRQW